MAKNKKPVEEESASITDYLLGSNNPFSKDVEGPKDFLLRVSRTARTPLNLLYGAAEGIASSLDYQERWKDRLAKGVIKASTLLPSFNKKVNELGGIEKAYELYDLADDAMMKADPSAPYSKMRTVSDALHGINAWAEKDLPKNYKPGLVNEATHMAGFIAPSLLSPDKYFKAAYFMSSMAQNTRLEADHSAEEAAISRGLTQGTPEFNNYVNSNEMLIKKAGSEALGIFMGGLSLLGAEGSSTLNQSLWKEIASKPGIGSKLWAFTGGVVKNIPQAAVSAGVLSLFRVAQNAINIGLIGGKDLIDDDNFFDSKLFAGTSKDALLGAVFHYVHAQGEKPIGTPEFEATANRLIQDAVTNPEAFARDNQTIMRNAQLIDASRITPERTAEIRQNTINEIVQESFKVNFGETPFDSFIKSKFNESVQKLPEELRKMFPDITPEEIQKAQMDYIGQERVVRQKQIDKTVDVAIDEQINPNKSNITDLNGWLKEKLPDITDYELSEASLRYVTGLELKGFSAEKPNVSQLLQEKYTPEQWAAMNQQEKLRVINEHLSQRANVAVPVKYYEDAPIQKRIDKAQSKLGKLKNQNRPKSEEKAKKYDKALKEAEEELNAARQQKDLIENRSGEVVGESVPMGELEQLIRDGGLTPKQVDDAIYAWQKQQGEPRLQDQPGQMYDQPSPMLDQPSPMQTVPERTYDFVSPDGTVRKFATQTELDAYQYRDLGYKTSVNFYNDQIAKAKTTTEKNRLIRERNAVLKQWNKTPGIEPPSLPYEVVGKYKDGIAIVESQGKLGLVSASGVEIAQPKYDSIGEFVEGFARFTRGDKSGFVDVTGKEYLVDNRPTLPKRKAEEKRPKVEDTSPKTQERSTEAEKPKTTENEYKPVKVGDIYTSDGSAKKVGFGGKVLKNPENLPTVEIISEIIEPAKIVDGVIVEPAKIKTEEVFANKTPEKEQTSSDVIPGLSKKQQEQYDTYGYYLEKEPGAVWNRKDKVWEGEIGNKVEPGQYLIHDSGKLPIAGYDSMSFAEGIVELKKLKKAEAANELLEPIEKLGQAAEELKKSIDSSLKDTSTIKNNIEESGKQGNISSPLLKDALGEALDTIDNLIKKQEKIYEKRIDLAEKDVLFEAKKQIGLNYIGKEKLEYYYETSFDADALFEISKRKLSGIKGYKFSPEEGRANLLEAVEKGSKPATDYLAESYINGHIPAKKGYGPFRRFGIHPEESVEKQFKDYFGDNAVSQKTLVERYEIEPAKAKEMIDALRNPSSEDIVKGALLAESNLKNDYLPSIYTLDYAKKKLAELGFNEESLTVEKILKQYKQQFKDRLRPGQFNSGVDISPEIMLALKLSARAVREGIRTTTEFKNWAKNNIPPEQLAQIGEAKLGMSFERAQLQNQQSNSPMPTPTAIQMQQDLMPELKTVSFENPKQVLTYVERLIGDTLSNIADSRMKSDLISLKMKSMIPDPAQRQRIAEYLDSSRVQTLSKAKQDLLDLLAKDQTEKQKVKIGVDEKTKKPIYKDFTMQELAERKRIEIRQLEDVVKKEVPLTGKDAEVAKIYRDAMADIGLRAYDAGVIKGLITDYVTHIVRQSSVPLESEGALIDSLISTSMDNVNSFGNKLTTKSPFAKERFYETFADLEKAIKDKGLEVKTKDIAEIYKNYSISMERAIHTKNLIQSLKNTQVGVDMNNNPRYAIMQKVEGKSPSGYSSINHPSLFNLSVANELRSRLDFAFDSNASNKYFKMALAISQVVKRANVFGSLFHAKALGESFFNSLNPALKENFARKAIISESLIRRGLREGSPEYLSEMNNLSNLVQYATTKQALDSLYKQMQIGGGEAEFSKWIKSGLTWEEATSDVNKKAGLDTVRALDKYLSGLLEKDIPPEQRKRYLEKIYEEGAESKVGKQVGRAVEGLDQFTWEYLHKGMKFYSAEVLEQRLIEKNPNITPEELKMARREIAQHVNTAFGGLNWFEMALSSRTEAGKNFALSMYKPSSRPFMQFLVFAPDWTISTLRQFKELLPKNLELSKVTDTQYLAEFFGSGLDGLKNPRTAADFARRAQLKQAFLYMTLYNAVNYALVGRPLYENKDPFAIDNGDGTKTEISKHAMEGYHFLEDPSKYSGNKLAFFPRAVITMIDTKYRKSNFEKMGEVLQNMLPFQIKPMLDAPDLQTGLKRSLLMALGFPSYNLSDADRQLKKIAKETDPDYYKRKNELEEERFKEAKRKSEGTKFRERRNEYLKRLFGFGKDKAEEESKK
jgi:hypothetical protein